MLNLNSKMFEESKKSTASKNLFSTLITFFLIFIVILVAESVIPTIMSYDELQQRILEEGITNDIKKTIELSTEINMQAKYLIPSLLCTVFGTLISIIYCRFIEARHLSSMGMRKKKIGIHYLHGLGIGLALMTIIVLISLIFGIEKITLCSEINFGLIGLFLLGFFLQGMSEEFIFRGYLMNTIGANHHPYIAVGISAAAFSLAHIMNPGFSLFVFFNLAIFGVFAGLYMIAFDDIWGACAIHSIWNFTQGCFYGISVSGTGDTESVFRTTPISASVLLTGGDFGIEGSIVTTIVLLGAISVIILKIKKQTP